jgi:hypothetical protein
MDPIEASLSSALLLATSVLAAPLAPRRMGSCYEWHAPWSVLPRLLLGLMAPLFVAGLMNLLWIAALARLPSSC